jgi:predicted GTPase
MPTATSLALQCQELQSQVESILQLIQQEPTLRSQLDSTTVLASLKKAIAPSFEIVFAGAFSAGKSMLINALLGRKLLYSAEDMQRARNARLLMLNRIKSALS